MCLVASLFNCRTPDCRLQSLYRVALLCYESRAFVASTFCLYVTGLVWDLRSLSARSKHRALRPHSLQLIVVLMLLIFLLSCGIFSPSRASPLNYTVLFIMEARIAVVLISKAHLAHFELLDRQNRLAVAAETLKGSQIETD